MRARTHSSNSPARRTTGPSSSAVRTNRRHTPGPAITADGTRSLLTCSDANAAIPARRRRSDPPGAAVAVAALGGIGDFGRDVPRQERIEHNVPADPIALDERSEDSFGPEATSLSDAHGCDVRRFRPKLETCDLPFAERPLCGKGNGSHRQATAPRCLEKPVADIRTSVVIQFD